MIKKFRIVFLILIVAVLAVLFQYFYKNRIQSSEEMPLRNIKRLKLSRELEPVSRDSLVLFDNARLVEAEGASLKARNMDGNIIWSLQMEGPIKELIGCGQNIIAITMKNEIWSVDPSGRLTWEYKLESSSASILIDEKGYVLIQYNEASGNRFEIFDVNGVRYTYANIDNSYVLSFGVFKDQYFSISFMDISSNAVQGKTVTYNEKGEILWAYNSEESLALKINYGYDNNVTIASEDSIKKFKTNGKLLKELRLPENTIKIDISESMIGIIVKKSDYYEIHSYDYNFKELGALAVHHKPLDIFAGIDSLIFYNKDSLTRINNSGKTNGFYESSLDINDAYINKDKKIYIISNRKLLELL